MRQRAYRNGLWSGQASADSTAVARQHPDSTATVYRRVGKRALDLTLGLLLFVSLVPVFAVVAIAVLLAYGWPVLYVAKRVGRDGQPFRMWKFRTMVRDADKVFLRWKTEHPSLAAEYERDYKLKDDPRIMKLGRFLRASSIDELPQLWNVLRGEMSLVGPRPVTEPEVRRYGQQVSTFLSVRPGMTGRWQLTGRNSLPYQDRIWLELDYCNSISLLGDARILLRSLIVPLRFDGR